MWSDDYRNQNGQAMIDDSDPLSVFTTKPVLERLDFSNLAGKVTQGCAALIRADLDWGGKNRHRDKSKTSVKVGPGAFLPTQNRPYWNLLVGLSQSLGLAEPRRYLLTHK